MNELTNAPQGADRVTQKTIEDYLFSSGSKLSEQQKKLFLHLAVVNNLNPFKREIYAIAYGNEFSVVTGYQVYLARAEATGLLDGWSVIVDQDCSMASICINRKDWTKPFTFTVDFDDFCKVNSQGHPIAMWAKMPKFMLKKICIGIGFRLCFPNQLGSMPYLEEEMVREEKTVTVEPAKTVASTEIRTETIKAPVEEKNDIITPRTDEEKVIIDMSIDQCNSWIEDGHITAGDIKATVQLIGKRTGAHLKDFDLDTIDKIMKNLKKQVEFKINGGVK